MEKYIIHSEDGFIYKLKGNSSIDEISGLVSHLSNEELKNYKEITKDEYYEIYYATKGNCGTLEDEEYLFNLINNVLQ